MHLPPRLESGDIPGLDGLRAISVLLVMVSHFGLLWISAGASLGVTIFFFISGFLITVLFLREYRSHGAISISRFYLRRILRLYPELLVLLLISGIAGVAYVGIPGLMDVAAALFYFTNYYQVGALADWRTVDVRWPALWTLAVEEHFYLTYPLILSMLIAAPKRLLVS